MIGNTILWLEAHADSRAGRCFVVAGIDVAWEYAPETLQRVTKYPFASFLYGASGIRTLPTFRRPSLSLLTNDVGTVIDVPNGLLSAILLRMICPFLHIVSYNPIAMQYLPQVSKRSVSQWKKASGTFTLTKRFEKQQQDRNPLEFSSRTRPSPRFECLDPTRGSRTFLAPFD